LGFVGQLLQEGGHETVVVDRNPALVDHLNRTGYYETRLVWGREMEEIVVDGVEAVSTADPESVIREVADSDLVATAVGIGNLSAVAPLIAAGLRRRDAPVNVIAFENLADPGGYLHGLVAKCLPSDFPLDRHGFSGAVVSRAVTKRIWREGEGDPVRFIGDPPRDFVVDRSRLRAPVPALDGLVLTENFAAWVRKKLYVYSAGHATCAYLGNLKGYHYIHTAIRDPEIRHTVTEAMAEGQRGLAAEYGTEFSGGAETLREIVKRFENPGLRDPIARVARDPQRKLARGDRLAGAADCAERAGVRPDHLALGIAAALCFRDPSDPSATELRDRLNVAGGLRQFLRRVVGLNPTRGVGKQVATAWGELSRGIETENSLLSLANNLWACEPQPR
jgi:mannitol-1-phosphate 5-dehydrogenase